MAGSSDPFMTLSLNSYVADMMLESGQQSLIDEYGLQPFEVKALRPERTICEKIMSLVRFSYSDTPLDDLKLKIRHTYDLHKLLENAEPKTFFESSAFDELLLKVAQDDVASFRNNNAWLVNHPKEALIFAELNEVWPELKSMYLGSFSNLVYGTLPDEVAVFETLSIIKDRLSTIEWNITLDK